MQVEGRIRESADGLRKRPISDNEKRMREAQQRMTELEARNKRTEVERELPASNND